jgi:hypothetical protein
MNDELLEIFREYWIRVQYAYGYFYHVYRQCNDTNRRRMLSALNGYMGEQHPAESFFPEYMIVIAEGFHVEDEDLPTSIN